MAEPIVALRQALVDQRGYVKARSWSTLFQWLKARMVGEPGTCAIRWFAGDPNGSIPGNPGDVVINTNGGANVTLYVKESGVGTSAGWVGK